MIVGSDFCDSDSVKWYWMFIVDLQLQLLLMYTKYYVISFFCFRRLLINTSEGALGHIL